MQTDYLKGSRKTTKRIRHFHCSKEKSCEKHRDITSVTFSQRVNIPGRFPVHRYTHNTKIN